MLFDYCYKALWRLSYEAREGRVFDMSVNGIRGLLRLSSAVRQKFFELLTNYNYKVEDFGSLNDRRRLRRKNERLRFSTR